MDGGEKRSGAAEEIGKGGDRSLQGRAYLGAISRDPFLFVARGIKTSEFRTRLTTLARSSVPGVALLRRVRRSTATASAPAAV